MSVQRVCAEHLETVPEKAAGEPEVERAQESNRWVIGGDAPERSWRKLQTRWASRIWSLYFSLLCSEWFEQNKDGFKSRTVSVVLAEITRSSIGKTAVTLWSDHSNDYWVGLRHIWPHIICKLTANSLWCVSNKDVISAGRDGCHCDRILTSPQVCWCFSFFFHLFFQSYYFSSYFDDYSHFHLSYCSGKVTALLLDCSFWLPYPHMGIIYLIFS